MKLFLSACLSSVLWLFAPVADAQQTIEPVIPGDFADPSIIRKGNEYFAVGTSSEWAPHFPIYSSTNLTSWKQVGYVFDKAPEWTSGSFWAPEYYFHNNTYYIYYTARRKKDNTSFIGVATSKYPDKGFTDHGLLIEFGKEAIDPFIFNDNGQLYISFKAYGLDKRPIELLGSKLSADGLKLEGELFSMLKDEPGIGMEGQSILKKDDYYYLFYSAGGCCGMQCSYNVRVARSKTYQGPYELYEANPILSENDGWKCMGHGSFVQAPQGKTFYLHHGLSKKATVYGGRQGMLAELKWPMKNGWPTLTSISSPKVPAAITDAFKSSQLAGHWQWDFRHASPATTIANGELRLSGTVTSNNPTGIALTVRPTINHFEMTVTVQNHNAALKGLVYYGDANAAVGLGVAGDSVLLWMTKENKRTVIASTALTTTAPIKLKIVLATDATCRFYYQQKNGSWLELSAGNPFSTAFLPQWDRSPRPGLHFNGNSKEEAVFRGFQLRY